jgi:hypothetical protein
MFRAPAMLMPHESSKWTRAGRMELEFFWQQILSLFVFFFYFLAVAHEQRLVVENPEKYFRSRQGSLTPSSTIDEIPAVPRPKVNLLLSHFKMLINMLL